MPTRVWAEDERVKPDFEKPFTYEETEMSNENNRVLGRVLAVEELANVSGGWTRPSEGDTTKSQDTGTHQVDTTLPLIDAIGKSDS